ncbi:MAG: thymidylate synthase [Candidatus Aenigmarchaeota archaeon]|nr:thymidylate synthase [Candidatus Aenigmarchaeota archaeon]
MKAYLDIVRNVLGNGTVTKSRTGTDAIAIAGAMFEHDMAEGFPLLTTKKVPFRLVASELEFFIKGMTDKQWLIDNDNHIWDDWASQDIVAYGHEPETKKKMLESRELGPIYGWQWRHFGARYITYDRKPEGNGVDQLTELARKLKEKAYDRRMLVTAWNPADNKRMALPPCHYAFQITVIGNRLNLMWSQRSVDVALGLPFNIASYGLLLHLLAKEANLREGRLVGFLGDTHVYVNHADGLQQQAKRTPFKLPEIKTENFTSIFDWGYKDTKADNYQHHPSIKFEIAV